ncbi:UNVERIFIED_CONTAM: hypothetical protein Cloal_3052 [Acetivibrio alkalicellulosi]
MKSNLKKTDIRIIKYEEYVKKYPQKAYGFYCLGRLYLMLGQYKISEEYFIKSLSIDSQYTLAKIGLVESYIFRKKFMKAVYIFSKYRQDINNKYIFRVKLVRGVSSFYSKNNLFSSDSIGFFSMIFLKYTMHYAKGLVKKESNNIVLKILLCMYYLKSGESNIFVTQMFKTCVYWDGLDDSLRWELLKALSDVGEKLIFDTNIAGKFLSIPNSSCSDEYVDMILGSSIIKGNKVKTCEIYNLANKFNKQISPNVLWRYLYWSRESSICDYTVYDCCKKLVRLGWMDKLVAETLLKIKDKKIVKLTKDDEHFLKLYGYI